MVVLALAGLVANAFGNLVRGATEKGGFSNPDLLSKIAKIIVWAFAIVIAVNQIGIASTLINTLLMATVGAVALACGLAFGLGGKDAAAEALRKWRQSAEAAAPKLKAAAKSAENDTPAAMQSVGMKR